MDPVEAVCKAVAVRGPGYALHAKQIQRLAIEWGPLAGALASLLRENGYPVPVEWVQAEQKWGAA